MNDNDTKRPRTRNAIYLGLLLFVIAQILVFSAVIRMDPFLEEQGIHVPTQPSEPITLWPREIEGPDGEVIKVPPHSAAGPILIYVLSAAAVLGVTLSVIPLSALKVILRLVFAILFSWGAFVASALHLPFPISVGIAVAFGALWFITPRIWLHNLVLILAVSSLGAVFGRFISPWTAMAVILGLAVYDLIAVRFKFMLWMADKLSEINALPALVIPGQHREWNRNLRRKGESIIEANPADREFSILGGGDIAFPCLLTASVFFARGLMPGAVVAALGGMGLISVYIIQAKLLKGRPMAALPPIAAFTLIGLLIVS